ncbi:MAG: nitrilase-related carbon-nitrogen hydrolase [Euryarchaeota archaeon]|nr:nitrilase-related carbon-nitrogen hydrolase [Euryarchaeota archaeon]
MVRVACVQLGAEKDRETTFTNAERLLESAASQGAKIACFPELTVDQFFPQYFGEEKFFSLAEPLDGPLVREFQRLAKKYRIALIPNLYEKGEKPDTYYDTSPVIDADGTLLGSQQMMHIAEDPTEDEKFYYTQGDRGYHLFSVAGLTIGIAICYDRHFPENMRILTLRGVEIIFVPTATTALHKAAWEVETRANAIVNGLFVAQANKVGREGEMEFFGNSLVVNPKGRIIAQASEKEEPLIADIDPTIITETRKEWPFLRDRRPKTYGELTR